MLKIKVVRHGQNEDNAAGILNGHRNLPLTDLGKDQGREIARHLKDTGEVFDAVYASPLMRAFDTAEIITGGIGTAPPKVLDLIIERDFGSMTGKPVSDIEPLCAPRIIKTPTVTYFIDPPGAETFPALRDRAQRALDHLHALHPKGSLLLVCHGDIGKMLYAAYYGLSWREVLTEFHFGNSEMILLKKGLSHRDAKIFCQPQYNL